MSTSKEIIGRLIKTQRKKKKLTQQQLGDMLGADRQYVWKLENGKKNITLDYLDKVIATLESKQDDFLKTTDTR